MKGVGGELWGAGGEGRERERGSVGERETKGRELEVEGEKGAREDVERKEKGNVCWKNGAREVVVRRGRGEQCELENKEGNMGLDRREGN